MSLFKKNPNEIHYTEGKKHWADVIKNSGDGNLLIWRQPEEDFNTNSTLIVMPGEEAIFVKGGDIHQVFEKGTYQLSTENYPFISRLRNARTGGISTFNCVVYFVRKAHTKEILWGTDSPIQVRDNVYKIRTEAKARGSYKIQIENAALFLEKMIGNNIQSQRSDDMVRYFSNEFQGKIKSIVSDYLNRLDRELIGIDSALNSLSEQITPYIDDTLKTYGLRCINFSLAGLDIDTQKYDQLDQSQIELFAKTKGFEAEKAGLDILGEDWTRVQQASITKDLANNTGGAASTGAGLAMGLGTMGAFAQITQQNTMPITGSQPAIPSEDPFELLSKLKKMLDAQLITQDEYDRKKAEILQKM